MAHPVTDMATVCGEKELAVEAEAVHTEVDGADVPYHKSRLEKRLVLKQDLSMVVLLSGCYWFAYLVCPVSDIDALDLQSPKRVQGSWSSRQCSSHGIPDRPWFE